MGCRDKPLGTLRPTTTEKLEARLAAYERVAERAQAVYDSPTAANFSFLRMALSALDTERKD